MLKKKILSFLLAGTMAITMSTSVLAATINGDGATGEIPVNSLIGPYSTDGLPENPEVVPPTDLSEISVSIPISMAFQVATNVTTPGGSFVTADYKVINNSETKDVNLSLASFIADSANEFKVVSTDPVAGNGDVEMQLNLVYDGGTVTTPLNDAFSTETLLGTIPMKASGSTANEKNLTFSSSKFELGDAEGLNGPFNSKHTLTLKVDATPAP